MSGRLLNLTEAQARALAQELDHPVSSEIQLVKDKLARVLERRRPEVIDGQMSVDDYYDANG